MAAQTPTLVQQTASASTTLSPASFAPAFGAATTAGTTLIALVATANSSAGATITTPTNWTLAGSSNNASIGLWVYVYPNNAGGLTTITFAGLSNLFALSVSLLEFSGLPLGAVLDPQTGGPLLVGSGPIISLNTSAASLGSALVVPRTGNELWLGLIASNATQPPTSTSTPSGARIGAWVTGTSATSTTGTNNISTTSLYAIPGPYFLNLNQNAGSFQVSLTTGAAVFVGVCMFALASLSSSALSQMEGGPTGGMSWAGAGAGQAVGV